MGFSRQEYWSGQPRHTSRDPLLPAFSCLGLTGSLLLQPLLLPSRPLLHILGSALFAANWFLSPRIALTFMLTKIPFLFLLLQWTDSFNVVVLGAGKIKNNNPIWLAETLSRYSLRVMFYCLFVCLFFMEKHPCLNNVKSIWFPAVWDQALSSLPRKPSEIPGCPQLSSHAGVLRRQSGRCEVHDWELCPIFSP